MAAEEGFREALQALTAALREVPAPSMIIGGMAVIAAGVPRSTIDIDATILGRSMELESAVEAFGRHGIVPRIAGALEFARERQVLLLRHDSSGVTIEVTFAWLPFEEEAINRAVEIEFEGIILRVARPEDLIIYKAAAWRDRDRSDIERLLNLHWRSVDLDRVRDLIRQIAKVLDDPTRLARFDEMVAVARQAK